MRKRVLAVIDELGYSRIFWRRAFAEGRRCRVGFVIRDL